MFDIKKSLEQSQILLAPDIEKDHTINALLNSALSKLTVSQPAADIPNILWGENRFGYQKSSHFQKLSQEQKDQILRKLTELNLSLSYWIEKSGHNYGAKMILLSETLQEKSLYALFAAEEAIHLREFQNFMNFNPEWSVHQHPMLTFLSKVIAQGNKPTLVFVVQVLLEGFGMGHYHSLKEDCLHAPLKEAYSRILRDEAAHHGAGIILAPGPEISSENKDQIFEFTRSFITSLQSASWPLKVMEEVSGELTEIEKKRFLDEIEYEKTLSQRRLKFREMIQKADHIGVLARLEKEELL
jgi:hypothetical protein